MITVITRKEVPTGIITCSNCGSKLQYTNGDLYQDTDYSGGYNHLYNYYFYCPVCGCKQYADWIDWTTSTVKEDKDDKNK